MSETNNTVAVAELGNAAAQDLSALSGSFAGLHRHVGDTPTPAAVVGSAVVQLDGTPVALPAGAAALTAAGAFALTGATSKGGVASIGRTCDPATGELVRLRQGQSLTITYTVKVNDGTVD